MIAQRQQHNEDEVQGFAITNVVTVAGSSTNSAQQRPQPAPCPQPSTPSNLFFAAGSVDAGRVGALIAPFRHP